MHPWDTKKVTREVIRSDFNLKSIPKGEDGAVAMNTFIKRLLAVSDPSQMKLIGKQSDGGDGGSAERVAVHTDKWVSKENRTGSGLGITIYPP
ncbi:hypothetical protein L2E82_25126 [Cichorium intybus]|uniref:Uncharacterized protein n=1 Tax=Cichorium intybus TaxID=13427 RepID=A0ACB9E2Y4_CICIN|nr:hypothetical protein L2E82_25126 [Cichorium intybus]